MWDVFSHQDHAALMPSRLMGGKGEFPSEANYGDSEVTHTQYSQDKFQQ